MRNELLSYGCGLRTRLLVSALVMLALSLIFGPALSGCASPPAASLQAEPARLSPPPPELMSRREPNLRQRLLQLSKESPTTGTKPSGP